MTMTEGDSAAATAAPNAGAAASSSAAAASARCCATDAPTTQPPTQPPFSRRIRATHPPVVAKTKALIAAARDPSAVASLAQGVVFWPPPRAALRAAARLTAAALEVPEACARLSFYGPTPGEPRLREALKRRHGRLGLRGYSPIVTPGGQSAFAMALLALCDEDDEVVLFPPLYFNERMAVEMTGGAARLALAPLREDLRPDLDWLEARIGASASAAAAGTGTGTGTGTAGTAAAAAAAASTASPPAPPPPPRVIVLVNPSNPTGVLLTRAELDRASALAARAGAWLVVDNTYCDLMFGGAEHYCPAGPHVIHLFSMSKAYGLMGWRIGWIALPPDSAAASAASASAAPAKGSEDLGDGGALMSELLKVQDSVPIMAAQISQLVALAALEGEAAVFGDDGVGGVGGDEVDELFGEAYTSRRARDLEATNRRTIRAALEAALGAGAVRGGEAGIYFFARLPPGFETRDEDAVRWLVTHSGVCVLPGSACAAPGWLRVAFANLPPPACEAAAERLRAGLEELVARGVAALDDE